MHLYAVLYREIDSSVTKTFHNKVVCISRTYNWGNKMNEIIIVKQWIHTVQCVKTVRQLHRTVCIEPFFKDIFMII